MQNDDIPIPILPFNFHKYGYESRTNIGSHRTLKQNQNRNWEKRIKERNEKKNAWIIKLWQKPVFLCLPPVFRKRNNIYKQRPVARPNVCQSRGLDLPQKRRQTATTSAERAQRQRQRQNFSRALSLRSFQWACVYCWSWIDRENRFFF